MNDIFSWAFTGLITIVFTVLGFLLKNAFVSFKQELQELKKVMSAILEFISTQKEKNINTEKEITDLWNKIDEIETKQDSHTDILSKIKMMVFKHLNERI